MLIVLGFVVVAATAWYFVGWRAGAEILIAYVFCQIGANSPQTFRNSKVGLERIAESAAAKAKVLALKGKS